MILSLLCLSPLAQAIDGYYLPTGELFVKKKDIDEQKMQIEIRNENGKYRKVIVEKSQVSLRTRKPVNDVNYGWVLVYSPEKKKYDHCRVLHLFENGTLNAFCYFYQGRQLWRADYHKSTREVLPEIKEFQGFKEGDRAVLTKDTAPYKKGEKVIIRAVFHGLAVVQKDYGLNIVKGPKVDGASFVVGIYQGLSSIEKVTESLGDPAQAEFTRAAAQPAAVGAQ